PRASGRLHHRVWFRGARRADYGIWWWGRTCLVSDSERWLQRASESVPPGKNALLEPIPWAAAPELKGPLSALVVHVENPDEECVHVFESWAARAWQPLCLVQAHPVQGLAAFYYGLLRLGYRAIQVDSARGAQWASLREHLERQWRGYVSLVPLLADGLGCRDPLVVEALAVAAAGQPRLRTVKQWAEALGLPGYGPLEVLLTAHGLPSPKHLLGLIRLAAVMAYARKRGGRCRREKLAAEFLFPSGDYLGKRTKQLVGIPLCRLVGYELEEALARIAPSYLEKPPPHEEKPTARNENSP
ncbi:MAG: hypothetical protein ACE5HP_07520, partial [Gemmatimonadota bacterium]